MQCSRPRLLARRPGGGRHWGATHAAGL